MEESLLELLKLGGQFGISALVAIMTLKFLFKIVENKFIEERNMEQKNYEKNIEISHSVNNIAKTLDRVSNSQEKISESQSKIVTLIESVDRKINNAK